MIICSAGYQFYAAFGQTVCQSLRVFHYFFSVLFKFRFQSFTQANCFTCNHMHQGTTLNTRKNCFVNGFCIFFFTKNQSASGAAQCFVGCCCYNVRPLHRIWMNACCNQTCNMRHIYHKHSAYFICNFTQTFKINDSCICTCTCNNHFWFYFFCLCL